MEQKISLETLKSELENIQKRYGGILTIAFKERDFDTSLMGERPNLEKVLDVTCTLEIRDIT